MKFRTVLAATAMACVLTAGAARACDFKPEDAQHDVDKAESVFTGGVTGAQHLVVAKGTDEPEFKTMFNADKIYKGKTGGAVNVIQMHDAWGHYVTFNTGKEYLVLAGRNEYGLLIDGCSPVMALDPADARSDEPGADYKAAVAKALGDENLFGGAVAGEKKDGGKADVKAAAKAMEKVKAEEGEDGDDADKDGK